MKKILFMILVALLTASFAWTEPNFYFVSKDSGFNLDLGSSDKDGAGNGVWSEGYTDSDIIGILGLSTNTAEDKNKYMKGNEYTVTFELISASVGNEQWAYSSVGDPTLQIPFGLDFVLRYNTKYGNTGETDGKTDKYFGTNGYQHLGYNSEGVKSEAISSDSFSVKPGDEWASFWFDIVLVIPDKEKWKTTFGNAYDYQAEFKVTIKNKDEDKNIEHSHTVYLSGYYGDDPGLSGASIEFSVTPSPLAQAINLSELGAGEVTIADYHYRLPTIVGPQDVQITEMPEKCPIKLFVSSSQNINGPSGEFKLKHVDASPENNALAVNIPFEIRIKSDSASDSASNSDVKWYQGTDTRETTDLVVVEGQIDHSSSRPGYGEVVDIYDDGEILFRIKDGGTTNVNNTFVKGQYRSDIYIHLFSEL